jgi:hypothetical protein
MSRAGEGDYDENFPNEWAFWEWRTRQVLSGRPGRKALAELREALLALPEKRLVANALSTVGKREVPATATRWYAEDHNALIREQGEGVCAVGAFVWHQRVKAGADAAEAMRDLPLNPDYDGDPELTVETGKAAGLTWTLAWLLMSKNDDDFKNLTPEERYDAFLAWIDARLAKDPSAAAIS